MRLLRRLRVRVARIRRPRLDLLTRAGRHLATAREAFRVADEADRRRRVGGHFTTAQSRTIAELAVEAREYGALLVSIADRLLRHV